MLLRFQRERQRRAGKGGKAGLFGLEEEEGGYEEDEEYGGFRLTHKGRALGADDYRDADALGSSDEEEDGVGGGALGREIVKVCWFVLLCLEDVCVEEGVGSWRWLGLKLSIHPSACAWVFVHSHPKIYT